MEISENLKQAISFVWSQIAHDAGHELGNEDAIEISFDADRLVSIAENPAAQIELRALMRAHSYSSVLEELGEQIKLM
jgi:hypothetical protein